MQTQEPPHLEDMMRRFLSPLLVASCIALPGCIVGFRHPLGPVASGFIDARLLGTWQCTGADEANPGVMTVFDFDGKQYYMLDVSEGKPPTHTRAYATRVGGVPFLNLQEIGAAHDDEWLFMEYVFTDAEHLSLRMVDPQPFREVIDNERQVRKMLERRRNESSLFVSLGSCVRAAGNAQ